MNCMEAYKMDIDMAESLAKEHEAHEAAKLEKDRALVVYPFFVGQYVTYLRCDKDGTVRSGTGILNSIYISDDKRKMALVKDAKEATDAVDVTGCAYNVELITINYTPQIEESYRAAMADIHAISKEGNDKIKAIVEEYNAKVDAVYKMLSP
jgi:hypothetical protein